MSAPPASRCAPAGCWPRRSRRDRCTPPCSIGGQWREAASGARLDCIDPTTEELLGTVPAGTAADADLAVAAAQEASGAWRGAGLDAARRAAARPGRPPSPTRRGRWPASTCWTAATRSPACARDVASAIRRAALLRRPGRADPRRHRADRRRRCSPSPQREPYGVVLRIVPFNHPFKFACGKAAAGARRRQRGDRQAGRADLAVGGRAGRDRGVGAAARGALVVTGTGAEVGDALVAHPGVPRVAFTGSVPTGRRILAHRRGEHQPRHPGAGRQEPARRLPGRRPGVVGAHRRGQHEHRPQQRPVLRLDLPGLRARGDPGAVPGRAGAAAGRSCASATRWTTPPTSARWPSPRTTTRVLGHIERALAAGAVADRGRRPAGRSGPRLLRRADRVRRRHRRHGRSPARRSSAR